MSTTAIYLGRGSSVVAIAGATGRLGREVIRIFTSPAFKPFFSRVIALTRDVSSAKAKGLAESGAEVHGVDFAGSNAVEQLTEMLRGVDVVINVLGGDAHDSEKDAILHAAVKARARVYFPSEFGVDHRSNNFADYDYPLWIKKRDHVALAKSLVSDESMRIVSVYTGFFTEMSIGPWFGFDLANKAFTSYGSPSMKMAFTSLADVARSLAELSIHLMAPTSDFVPDFIRIAGCHTTFEEIAASISGVTGTAISVKSLSVEVEKEKLRGATLAGELDSPAEHIRILVGEGNLDFSSDNMNEVVNPKESVWKWKTVYDFILETEGRCSSV